MVRVVMILANLWLIVKGCEEETNYEESEKAETGCCCSIIYKAIAYALVGAATIQGALSCLGFGQDGITADSKAAGFQSRIGNVAKDSAFSKTQSMGMSTYLGCVPAPIALGAVIGVIFCFAETQILNAIYNLIIID